MPYNGLLLSGAVCTSFNLSNVDALIDPFGNNGQPAGALGKCPDPYVHEPRIQFRQRSLECMPLRFGYV